LVTRRSKTGQGLDARLRMSTFQYVQATGLVATYFDWRAKCGSVNRVGIESDGRQPPLAATGLQAFAETASL
jgi:hypothetical protein